MARHNENRGVSAILRRIGSALVSARARAVMSIGIVLGLGAVGTLAAWSDTSTATSGTFTTGTIDIKLGDPAVDNNPPAFATTLANAAIMPGNIVSAPLKVINSGSVPFTYTISVAANNERLGNLLHSSVYAGSSCTAPAVSTVTGLWPLKPFEQSTTPVGNLTRPIPAGGSDQLCISVTMPSTATAPAIPATGTVTYTLLASSG